MTEPTLTVRFATRSVLALAAVAAPAAAAPAQEPVAMKIAAPELDGIEAWINWKPVALKDLKGKGVVLHFRAFG